MAQRSAPTRAPRRRSCCARRPRRPAPRRDRRSASPAAVHLAVPAWMRRQRVDDSTPAASGSIEQRARAAPRRPRRRSARALRPPARRPARPAATAPGGAPPRIADPRSARVRGKARKKSPRLGDRGQRLHGGGGVRASPAPRSRGTARWRRDRPAPRAAPATAAAVLRSRARARPESAGRRRGRAAASTSGAVTSTPVIASSWSALLRTLKLRCCSRSVATSAPTSAVAAAGQRLHGGPPHRQSSSPSARSRPMPSTGSTERDVRWRASRLGLARRSASASACSRSSRSVTSSTVTISADDVVALPKRPDRDALLHPVEVRRRLARRARDQVACSAGARTCAAPDASGSREREQPARLEIRHDARRADARARARRRCPVIAARDASQLARPAPCRS